MERIALRGLGVPLAAAAMVMPTSSALADVDPLADLISAQPNLSGSLIGRYETDIFDEGASEIVAFDPATMRGFIVNSDAGMVDVIDLSDPTTPTLIQQVNVGGSVNSVDVWNGVFVAAVEGATAQDNGEIAIYSASDLTELARIPAGALPDNVVMSKDGKYILAANEGEPNDAYDNDPEGSVTHVVVSGVEEGMSAAEYAALFSGNSFTTTQINFNAWDSRKAELINAGIRIFGFGDPTVSQDLEPEYIAIAPNGYAYVALQENNALAVIDLETAEVLDILALGYKDHSRGLPTLSQYPFVAANRPVLGVSTEPGGGDILAGGFSGLDYDSDNSGGSILSFYTIGDRGPNGDTVNGQRPFLIPDYQAAILRIELDTDTGEVTVAETIDLFRQDGVTPITGLPNIPGKDEVPVDGAGNVLSYDEFGADMEGIVKDLDGTFWMCDEYRPAIYHFDANGDLIDRFVPINASDLGDTPVAEGTYGTETFPEEYNNRRPNRGFEGLALDTDNDRIFAFIQTPMDNPDSSIRNSDVLRILEIDASNGNPVAEYLYFLEGNSNAGIKGRVDKIGDAVYAGNGQFYVIERDSSVTATGRKNIFKIDLKGATNTLPLGGLSNGTEFEAQTIDALVEAGIQPVNKIKVTNLPSLGYLAGDKPEGLTMLEDGSLAVINDNDFGDLDPVIGIISFPEGENGLDPSDRDDAINIANWPVFGMFMPDTIAAVEINGATYIVTANEGDAREYDPFEEESRIKDLGDVGLELDSEIFPDSSITEDENLGRYTITTTMGDLDGDNALDQIFGFGGRSFSIFDEKGSLVFDSGSIIAEKIAELFPDDFNSNNDENDSFESRSDNKGTEPEAVAIGKIGAKTFAFIALERQSAVMVFDITNPAQAYYVDILSSRDFSGDAAAGEAGDLGPESIEFVPALYSPTGAPFLLVGNEVSGSTSVWGLEGTTLLQILHASDLEGGVEALEAAPDFAAIVEGLENQTDDHGIPSVVLSAGDNYIPGPFFSAAGDSALRTVLQDVYQDFFSEDGLTNLREGNGRVDISIMNAIGFDASAVGNHEFDAGTSSIEDIILTDIRGDSLGDVRWLGAQFPYLSSNLDFSNDGLGDFFTNDILPNTDFQSHPSDLDTAGNAPKLAPATVIQIGAEYLGVVGATTQVIQTISSPGDVLETTGDANDMVALAAVIQPQIDRLLPMTNKIVIVSHLQQIALEKELAGLLEGVDIIIAGGSDTLQANEENTLRDGDTAEEAYPFVTTNADGDSVVIVSTDGEYSYVGRLVVAFDLEGKLITDSLDNDLIGPYATVDSVVEALWGEEDPFAEGTRAELVQRLVNDGIFPVIIAKDSNILGLTNVFIEGRRSKVRTEETTLGNLTADANLWVAQQFDSTVRVSLKNGGGIRATIGEVVGNNGLLLPPQANALSGKEVGEISQLDIENSLRFNNGLTLLTVTAQELVWLLEHAVAGTAEGATPGQFPQVGGLAFSFDPTGTAVEFDDEANVVTAGTRVKNVVLLNENGQPDVQIMQDGVLVAPADYEIRMVTLNFLWGIFSSSDFIGGDGYPFPAFADNVVQLGDVLTDDGEIDFSDPGGEQDALAEYLLELFANTPFSVIETAAALDQRIQNLGSRNDGLVPGFDVESSLITAPAAGGTFQVAVETVTNGAWKTEEELDWLVISRLLATDTTTGNGPATVEVVIDANDSTSPRGGDIIIAGQAIVVRQDGTAEDDATFELDRNVQVLSGLGGTVIVTVTGTEGATWQSISQVEWISIQRGRAGEGDGLVILEVARNTGSARSGRVEIAGLRFLVDQGENIPNVSEENRGRVPQDIVENEDGSFQNNWFGRFFIVNENGGIGVHDAWGEIFFPEVQEDVEDALWFYDFDEESWHFTSDDVDPFVFSVAEQNWLYLLQIGEEAYVFSNAQQAWRRIR
ncbi:choice-of-anchor I domain-containing protein [Rubellicoccus peritrichatus]|uniref:Esterase-like activity of phytase family protein n=1 Tax=Rubellicoccus peritrichatus TaxID=3080537 RepID=A0AAQ3L7Y3_9BACT|nr:esterase-like activity of phytase family protein [Puniceicoccus sp. CR14]WOO39549.1 esterase-like activity of phytase family protein [Puniceicoccus sp. CR14]